MTMTNQYSFGMDECRCSCHTNENVYHCAPCCYPCPICHGNILPGHLETHIEECKKFQERIRERNEQFGKGLTSAVNQNLKD